MTTALRARHREGAAEDQASPMPGHFTADDGSALKADRRQVRPLFVPDFLGPAADFPVSLHVCVCVCV